MDFSELADRAFDHALVLAAQRSNAEVHAVTIVAAPLTLGAQHTLPAYLVFNRVAWLTSATERLRFHILSRVDAFAVNHPELPFPPRVESHATIDTPAHGIAQLASDLAADLVVVGTHNRRGLDRLLLGSVAEGTVRYARCPVLVIPAEQPDAEFKIEPPCPECVHTRNESHGQQLWCARHRERHGRRHTYHPSNRSGEEAHFPLVTQ
jgi:nucleotide-binding universal stress UspA family protein